MADDSMLNTTNLIQWFALAFVALLVLLGLVHVALGILRRLARQQVARTDLDLIGLGAAVTQTIRPGKTGKISCSVDNGGQLLLEAESDSKITAGKKVRIIAFREGRYRVVPTDRTAADRSAVKKRGES